MYIVFICNLNEIHKDIFFSYLKIYEVIVLYQENIFSVTMKIKRFLTYGFIVPYFLRVILSSTIKHRIILIKLCIFNTKFL